MHINAVRETLLWRNDSRQTAVRQASRVWISPLGLLVAHCSSMPLQLWRYRRKKVEYEIAPKNHSHLSRLSFPRRSFRNRWRATTSDDIFMTHMIVKSVITLIFDHWGRCGWLAIYRWIYSWWNQVNQSRMRRFCDCNLSNETCVT